MIAIVNLGHSFVGSAPVLAGGFSKDTDLNVGIIRTKFTSIGNTGGVGSASITHVSSDLNVYRADNTQFSGFDAIRGSGSVQAAASLIQFWS